MDPTNRISRYLPTALKPVRLDWQLKYLCNLHQKPVEDREVAQQKRSRRRALLDAYFRDLHDETNHARHVLASNPRTIQDSQTPPTEEDLRIHAWLTERLAALHRQRHCLWPRLLRFLRAIAWVPGRLWKL